MSSARRLWFAVALLAAAGAAAAWTVRGWGSPGAPVDLGWFVFPVMAIGANLPANMEFRGEALAIDFSTVSVVLALALSDRGLAVAAMAVAMAISAAASRVPMIKATFNVANGVLAMSLAAGVFRLIAGSSSPNSYVGWLALVAAATVYNWVGCIATGIVISVVNGRREPMRMMLAWATLACVGNCVLALLALQVIWVDWRGSWLIAVTAVGLWLGYRSFLTLRQRYASLNLLHGFSHALAGLTETDDVSATALVSAKELLRAEHAYLVFELLDGVAVRKLDTNGTLETLVDRSGRAPIVAQVLSIGDLVLVSDGDDSSPHRVLCEQLGVRDLVAAAFLADGVRGMFVVANRLSDVSTFDQEDAKVLATFAQHTAVALTVGELVDRLRLEVVDREFQALHDSLTGLPNRTRLLEELGEFVARAHDAEKTAVLLMDLDAFKDVNDTLGHTTGDALLKEIGRRLSAAVGTRGVVARLGGDEFAVGLNGLAHETDILEFVDALRLTVEEPYVVDRLSLAVRFSIGVSVSPDHGTDPKVLLQRADIAMYAAKELRSGTTIYADELDKSSTRRLSLAGELATALDQREFQLFYQPQLDLSSGEVMAIEALARWPHPEYKSVPPDEFIPLVEQTGLIGKFTDWALESALRDISLWRETWPQLRVSVNMSARNLNDPGFAASVRRHLASAGLGGEALTLELTESTVMGDPTRALEVLTELHGLGIRIAIDDFGTGYSSLSYLKKLPVDEVKIDKSFVMNMVGDDDDISIVRSTIDLARSLGMETVAEGVESPEAIAVLGELGCTHAQGYYLSRPLPSADIADKIRSLHEAYRQRTGGSSDEMRRAMIRQFSDLAR